MTAKEANFISNKGKLPDNHDQIQVVLDFIKQVAERGHYILRYYDPIAIVTINALMSLGYAIYPHTDEEGKQYVRISWKYA
jgi:hypothetical protein